MWSFDGDGPEGVDAAGAEDDADGVGVGLEAAELDAVGAEVDFVDAEVDFVDAEVAFVDAEVDAVGAEVDPVGAEVDDVGSSYSRVTSKESSSYGRVMSRTSLISVGGAGAAVGCGDRGAAVGCGDRGAVVEIGALVGDRGVTVDGCGFTVGVTVEDRRRSLPRSGESERSRRGRSGALGGGD
jgi:hypothetical protein